MDGSITIGVGLDVSDFMTSLSTLEATVSAAAAACVSAFGSADWSGAGSAAVSEIASGFSAGSMIVNAAAAEVSSMARDSFSTGWSGIGSSLMSGVASGIRAAGSEVVAAIRAVSADAEAAIKDFYQISSPSRLMRDEVGVMISRGIAEGITDGAPFVNSALTASLPMGFGSSSGALSGEAGANPGGRLTQNIYLRDADSSPYRTAKRIRRESEAIFR